MIAVLGEVFFLSTTGPAIMPLVRLRQLIAIVEDVCRDPITAAPDFILEGY